MLTRDQEEALASVVDAITGTLATLEGVPCHCREEFVCSRHATEQDLIKTVERIEWAFVTEPTYLPAYVYLWAEWLCGWAPGFPVETAALAEFRAEAMAHMWSRDRWAWTDEAGQLHEVYPKEAT